MALKRPPGLTRKWFGFQGWLEFDRPLWNAIRDDARRGMLKELPAPIRGSDVHRDAIELAKQNARAAGIGHLVQFERFELGEARPASGGRQSPDAPPARFDFHLGADAPRSPGTIICNPPYGERLGDEKELVGLYRKLGDVAHVHFPGWRLLVFTSNDWLARKVGLKVQSSMPFFNGKLPCRLWEYENG